KLRIITVFLAMVFAGARAVGLQTNGGQSTPKGAITGVVTKAGSSLPLKGAQVAVRRVDAGGKTSETVSAKTDVSGGFVAAGLDPGQYRITVERDGYIRQEYGQRSLTGPGTSVSVSAGQRLPLEFHLTPAGVISGRILDETGEPLYRAAVQAYTYQYRDGKRSLSSVASGLTNDLGEYRLFWLSPGEYFVSVTDQSSLRPATV